MLEFIASIIFVGSLGLLVLMLLRKMPALAKLPQNGRSGIQKHQLIVKIEEKAEQMLVYFKRQIILHKLLSKAKCWILKLEVRIDHLLHKIRKNAQKLDRPS